MKIIVKTKMQDIYAYEATGMDITPQTKTVLIHDKNKTYGFHIDDVEKIEVEENE